MNPKMRQASFLSTAPFEVATPIAEFMDLEYELRNRGIEVASHGRIKWINLPDSQCYLVTDDHDAAQKIASLIEKYQLTGEAIAVWSDLEINPILINVKNIPALAIEICEEDWDCWIFSKSGTWVIEKYHEGEVCFVEL